MARSVESRSSRHPRAFVWPVRIYYEDTDAGGVVYYANYLRFFERARTEWLRSLGVEQTGLSTVHGVVFVVRAITVEYHKPARFNDLIEITVEDVETGASRIRLRQSARRGPDALAAASVELACVEQSRFRPVRIPADLLERLRERQGATGSTPARDPGRS